MHIELWLHGRLSIKFQNQQACGDAEHHLGQADLWQTRPFRHEEVMRCVFKECCKSIPEVVNHKKAKPVRSLAFSAADELCETSVAPIFLANLGDPDFVENVKNVKLKCETERKEAEEENSVGS